ncbi:MAG: DinB family protein [Candidatus Acidiferrales bacterium]
MTEVQRIADQLRRAYEGEAWHGPSLRELLDGVTSAQAARRPLPQAHSIWELVLHITVWESVVRRRLTSEVPDPPPELDWPPVRDTSDAAWKQTLDDLDHGHQQLRQAISSLSDDRLSRRVLGKNYSIYGMLHGLVQHDLYHAGQIALLKKATSG